VPCALGIACSQGDLGKKIVNLSPHAWLDLAPDQGPFAEHIRNHPVGTACQISA